MTKEKQNSQPRARPPRKARVQRVEDWDNARYAITPPRAALDDRLTLIHFRLMAMLGRVNTAQGWCEMSQTMFAKALGYARGSVVRAVKELVDWRYVEKLGQAEAGSARCHYRLLVDDPEPLELDDPHGDCDTESEGDNGTCNVPRDTSTCNVPGDTCVTSNVTQVSRTKDTALDQRSKITPQTPQVAGVCEVGIGNAKEGSGWASGWTLEAQAEAGRVRSSPVASHVAAVFIDQVRGVLRPQKGADAAAYVRQLAHHLRDFQPDVLAAAATALIEARNETLPGIGEVLKVVRAAKARLAAESAAAAGSVSIAAGDPALAARWPDVVIALRKHLGPDVVKSWFDPVQPQRLAGDVLVLAGSPLNARWISQNYEHATLDACRSVWPGVVKIRFEKTARRAT